MTESAFEDPDRVKKIEMQPVVKEVIVTRGDGRVQQWDLDMLLESGLVKKKDKQDIELMWVIKQLSECCVN